MGIPPITGPHLAFCEGQELVTHRVPAQQVIRELPKSSGQLGLGGEGRPPLLAELQGKSLRRCTNTSASINRVESFTANRVWSRKSLSVVDDDIVNPLLNVTGAGRLTP